MRAPGNSVGAGAAAATQTPPTTLLSPAAAVALVTLGLRLAAAARPSSGLVSAQLSQAERSDRHDSMSEGDKMTEERPNGGCEGPDAMFVKLISSDGHEFIIKREHALTSGTIKAMLSGPGE